MLPMVVQVANQDPIAQGWSRHPNTRFLVTKARSGTDGLGRGDRRRARSRRSERRTKRLQERAVPRQDFIGVIQVAICIHSFVYARRSYSRVDGWLMLHQLAIDVGSMARAAGRGDG